MKKTTFNLAHFLIFCALISGLSKAYSQRDTLHIYFSGMQTVISDSNEVKIGNWAKKLKGKHWDVDILAYYEKSDLKKYMAERAENLNLMVTRKARDFMTIYSSGPVKGSKTQRYMADIVYSPSGSSAPAEAPAATEAPKAAGSAGNANNNTTNSTPSGAPSAAPTQAPAAATKPAPANGDYVYDSVYVNGKLKVTKRKVKK
jgi:hypothetical protein